MRCVCVRRCRHCHERVVLAVASLHLHAVRVLGCAAVRCERGECGCSGRLSVRVESRHAEKERGEREERRAAQTETLPTSSGASTRATHKSSDWTSTETGATKPAADGYPVSMIPTPCMRLKFSCRPSPRLPLDLIHACSYSQRLTRTRCQKLEHTWLMLFERLVMMIGLGKYECTQRFHSNPFKFILAATDPIARHHSSLGCV